MQSLLEKGDRLPFLEPCEFLNFFCILSSPIDPHLVAFFRRLTTCWDGVIRFLIKNLVTRVLKNDGPSLLNSNENKV